MILSSIIWATHRLAVVIIQFVWDGKNRTHKPEGLVGAKLRILSLFKKKKKLLYYTFVITSVLWISIKPMLLQNPTPTLRLRYNLTCFWFLSDWIGFGSRDRVCGFLPKNDSFTGSYHKKKELCRGIKCEGKHM